MTKTPTLKTLRNGLTVLANDKGYAKTFANLTQAKKAAESVAWAGAAHVTAKWPFLVVVTTTEQAAQ